MQVPPRLLMGPGPANAHPRVLAAQSLPLLGHMHPPFIKIMDGEPDPEQPLYLMSRLCRLCVHHVGTIHKL